MIRRLTAFIFNSDVKEILEELMSIEAQIIKTEKLKNKGHFKSLSITSASTNDPLNFQSKNQSTIKDDKEDINESLEMQKARKDLLESELGKLEEQERRRYDSITMIEKQNFEVIIHNKLFCINLKIVKE